MDRKYFVSNFDPTKIEEANKPKKVGQIKKIIIVLVVIFLIFIAGGFFWWQQNKEMLPEKWGLAEMSLRDNYVIEESSEGKVIENQKVGLRFEIEKDWNLEEGPSYTSYIAFYSPESELDENNYLLEKGCKIVVSASYIKTNLDTLESVLKENWPSLVLNEFSRIEISGQKAVKHIFLGNEEVRIYGIGIHLPYQTKVYEFALESALEDKQECEKKFYNFLSTISIK